MGGVMNPNAFYGAAKLPQGGIMHWFQQLNLYSCHFAAQQNWQASKRIDTIFSYGDQQD